MKVELRKVNEPTGTFWYGIWIDDSCQIPAFGVDLEAAKKVYEAILEKQKNPLPKYETIESTIIEHPKN